VVKGGEQGEPDAPEDVDDAGVAEGEAEELDGGHVGEGSGGGEEEDFGGGHG